MPQIVSLLSLSLVPAAVLVISEWASWGWVLLGAGAWVVAVVAKAVSGAGLWWALEKAGASARTKSSVWGVWSATCELGVAAAVFLGARELPSFLDMIGFGVGAGSIEALVVAGAAAASAKGEGAEDREVENARPSWFLAWSGVIERGLASAGHVASRGLVWVGIQSWILSPFALVALLTFGVVDGVSTYGSEAGWDWKDSERLKWLYALVAKVTAFEVIALVVGVLVLRA